jgi:hypothetical protein
MRGGIGRRITWNSSGIAAETGLRNGRSDASNPEVIEV